MTDIFSIPFDKESFNLLKEKQYGKNRPIVYLIKSLNEIYIGESINAYSRSKQHFENIERRKLDELYIISNDKFNKSATLDIESWLIQYMNADKKFKLQNKNLGIKSHNYFDRDSYRAIFELIWEKLQDLGIAGQDLVQLRNSDIFKFSPYKSLSYDQVYVTEEISKDILDKKPTRYLVNGRPGTGKTVLAIFLLKYLLDKRKGNIVIGLVVPMTSLRNTLRNVFRSISGLKSSMILGPNDIAKKKYDVLIVDEAHRLQRRKNITGYKAFDDINKKLGLGKDGDQLDWILKSSKSQIFFYDSNQSVKPSDIPSSKFDNLGGKETILISQMRVQGGENYIIFIDSVLEQLDFGISKIDDYDLKLFDSINDFVKAIKNKNEEYGLSRVVSGYSWDWISKKDNQKYDINIDGYNLRRNSTIKDWVNSANAINEVGCIHTIQGYDLNYVGVIFGKEIIYDKKEGKIKIVKDNYKDINGKKGTEEFELERYIINIYKTLLTRGILGTYIYIVDDDLRDYFRERLSRLK